MTAPETANHPKSTGQRAWWRIAFTCLGLISGAAYGVGISAITKSAPVTMWILALVGSGLLGLIGYRFSASPDYSKIQKAGLVLLVPPVLVASLVGMLLALVLFGVLCPVFIAQNILRERRFRVQMQAAGRYLSWQELLPLLESGDGTLIVETYDTGPFRIWYTEDDMLAKGEPISTDEEMLAVLGGKTSHVFNSRCLREYIDSTNGSASLTNILPARLRSGRFQKRFPHAKVVRLYRRPQQIATTEASSTE